MTTSTLNSKVLTAGVAASAILGGFAAFVLAIVWGSFWTGLAISMMWAWFVVPLFALPALSIPQAFGLVLLARMVVWHRPERKKEGDGFGKVLANAFVHPPLYAGMFLLVGYVVKIWA